MSADRDIKPANPFALALYTTLWPLGPRPPRGPLCPTCGRAGARLLPGALCWVRCACGFSWRAGDDDVRDALGAAAADRRSRPRKMAHELALDGRSRRRRRLNLSPLPGPEPAPLEVA